MLKRLASPLWPPIAAAFAVTLGLELALVERKFGIFGGGFGQSHQVDTLAEIAVLTVALAATHLFLLWGVLLLFRLVRGKADLARFRFDYLFVTISLVCAGLIAKFQVLSYFSDAISFQLIRNLGGGSLLDAFLFVLSESGLYVAALAGLIGLYLAGAYLVGRAAARRPRPVPRLWAKPWLLLGATLPFLILGANNFPDLRYALRCFVAYDGLSGLLAAGTDFDRDGYSWYTAQIDRHPFDGARHPLALDLPGNGIDEDGFGEDLILAGAQPPIAPLAPAAARKNLILIVLESTRGDVIGKRVGTRAVAPNVEALGRSGSVIPEAYSHVGFTTASLKSLFSGKLDPEPGTASLFRDLKRAGYRVGVFSGQPESFGDISQVVGMKESADIFVDAEVLREERAFSFAAQGSLLVDESKLLREFDRSFGTRAAWEKPVLLYFNFQSPHFPYHHPGLPQILPGKPIPRGEISLKNQQWTEATYWNSVAYADAQIGALIDRLKRLGVYDNSIVVVTADHGESLFDDGFLGHGHMINRQQTHIPLVIGQPGVRIEGPVGLNDYRRILLDLLSGRPQARPRGPVLQYIGTLDKPAQVGMVEAGGRWTVLDLDTEEVWLSELNRRARYRELEPALKARADRLIELWGRERWLRHVEQKRTR